MEVMAELQIFVIQVAGISQFSSEFSHNFYYHNTSGYYSSCDALCTLCSDTNVPQLLQGYVMRREDILHQAHEDTEGEKMLNFFLSMLHISFPSFGLIFTLSRTRKWLFLQSFFFFFFTEIFTRIHILKSCCTLRHFKFLPSKLKFEIENEIQHWKQTLKWKRTNWHQNTWNEKWNTGVFILFWCVFQWHLKRQFFFLVSVTGIQSFPIISFLFSHKVLKQCSSSKCSCIFTSTPAIPETPSLPPKTIITLWPAKVIGQLALPALPSVYFCSVKMCWRFWSVYKLYALRHDCQTYL